MNDDIPPEVLEKLRLKHALDGAKKHHEYVKKQHQSAVSEALFWKKAAASAQDHNRELAEANRDKAAAEVPKVTGWVKAASKVVSDAQAAHDANPIDLDKLT